jgi:hypothetical protein
VSAEGGQIFRLPSPRSSLINDLNQHPLAFLDAAGLHHGPERLRRPALATDHLAPIGRGDAQLEHDRVVVFGELTYLDLVGLVDQSAREKLEQLLQAIPFAFRSFFTVSLGSAPFLSQFRTRSSSSSIVEGSV